MWRWWQKAIVEPDRWAVGRGRGAGLTLSGSDDVAGAGGAGRALVRAAEHGRGAGADGGDVDRVMKGRNRVFRKKLGF